MLAQEVGRLNKTIREEEERTKIEVDRVSKKGGRDIDEACANWGEGEKIRREKWLERKTKEIREITIKGLEPEVQRIIDKHKVDCAGLDSEFERKKEDYLVDFYTNLDVKKEEFERKGIKKYNSSLATTRHAGNDRLSEVHSEHSENLIKLRKRLADESDSQRKWQNDELKRLAENHADSLANVRILEGKRLTEMRRRWVEEKDTAERQFKSVVDGLEEKQSIVNEQWERRIKTKLQKESLERIGEEREKLREKRDGDIELNIRSIQSRVAEQEKTFKEHFEVKAGGLKREHDRYEEKINEASERSETSREQHPAGAARNTGLRTPV